LAKDIVTKSRSYWDDLGMNIYVINLNECDPKRCTARKLKRFGLVKFIRIRDPTAKGAILLNPFSEKVLSKEDKLIIEKRGIVALDGSWKKIEEKEFRKCNRLFVSRALPYLVAGNPTHYGVPIMLSTVEALAFGLYITGFKEEAFKLLKIFSWGMKSFELNRELLELYYNASDAKEVIYLQNKLLNQK